MADMIKTGVTLVVALTVIAILIANILVQQINQMAAGDPLNETTAQTQQLYDLLPLIFVLVLILFAIGLALKAAGFI